MATFISLLNFTDQGMRNIKESPARLDAFRALVESQGGTVKAAYWTLGTYDLVVIVEGGTEDSAMISALTVGALGNVRGQTMNGFSADEMKGFISKMP